MRVIHLVEFQDNSYGGPAKSVPSIALNCSDESVKHQIVSADFFNAKNEMLDNSDVKWRKCGFIGPKKLVFSPRLFAYLFREAKKNEYILHLHNQWNFVAFAAFIVSFSRNVKVVVSPRGSLDDWSLTQGRFRKWLAWKLFNKRLFECAARIHVTSELERANVCRKVRNKEIHLIPNGEALTTINIDRNEISQLELIPEKYILFLGRINAKKNIENLIKAYSSSLYRSSHRLLIVGEVLESDKYVRNLKGTIDELGLMNDVIFFGGAYGLTKIELYQKAEIYILASHAENFGITVLEAMQCGCPVVVSEFMPWNIVDFEKAGFVCGTSFDEIKSSMDRFFLLSEEEKSLFRENAKHVSEKFGWNNISGSYKKLYSSLFE